MTSNTNRTMIALMVMLVAAVGAVQAYDEDGSVAYYDDPMASGDPRLLFTNFTSSLVQVNSTLLGYTLIALAIGGAAAVALYYLYIESANNRGNYSGYSQGYGQNYGYQQYSR